MKLKLKKQHVLFFLVMPLFSCEQKEYVNVKAFYYDWFSRRALELKQNEIAHESVLKALENQDEALLKSNLGITFDLIDKKSDAEKSLLSALDQAATDEEKFKYQYNLGVLFGAQKKIPEALKYYQAALDLVPNSIEIKHNIELLIQQQKKDQKSGQDKKDGQGQGDQQKDQKEDDQKNQKENKDGQPEDSKDPKKNDQDRKSNSKYKPRPFKGDQLAEGDVKKILGELSQQDQKIRAQFNKKEQRKEDRNEKDW